MEKIIKNSYKLEYETTDISKTELLKKYKLRLSDLPEIENWEKAKPDTKLIVKTEDSSSKEVIKKLSDPVATIASEDTKESIENFKKKALAKAHELLGDEVTDNIKEFKDLVNIVDMIERSYKGNDEQKGPTINVAVQNIVNKFKDEF